MQTIFCGKSKIELVIKDNTLWVILLKFIIRFPASKVSTINPDIGSKPTK
jgi:hypothetical protein